MVRTISCLPALVGAWRERGGGILGPTAWAAYSPLDQDALAGPQPDTRARQHGPPRARAHRARPARPRARGLQLQPGDDGARQHARHAGSGARRPLHRGPRALHDRHRPLRRRRAAGHDAGRARRPRALVGAHVRHLQRAGHRARRRGAAQHRDLPPPGARDGLRRRGVRRPPTRSSRGRRSRAPGRRWTRSTSSACARWGGPRPTCPRTSGRSRRAASGRRPGAFACGPTGLPPGFDPPPGDDEPLALMTAKSAHHFLNSTYANLPRHLAGEGEPLLELHPDDAAARGIADGDVVRVSNARGEVVARARLGDVVRPRRGRAALRLVGLAQPGRHHGQRADDARAHRPRRRRRLPFRSRRGRAGARTGRRGRQPGKSSSGGPMTRSRIFKLALPAAVVLGAGTAVAIAAIPVVGRRHHGCYRTTSTAAGPNGGSCASSTRRRPRHRPAQPARRRSRGTSRAPPGPQGDPGPARRLRVGARTPRAAAAAAARSPSTRARPAARRPTSSSRSTGSRATAPTPSTRTRSRSSRSPSWPSGRPRAPPAPSASPACGWTRSTTCRRPGSCPRPRAGATSRARR